MEVLYIIPARGGSKGLPGKNTKLLNGKPLIHYSIEAALRLTSASNICISTDDPAIKSVAEETGISVPFLRPVELASDDSSMDVVLHHALNFYEEQRKVYDAIVLLQPTSPFRTTPDIKNALTLYHSEIDMVMSVFETKANPYYLLFEEERGVLVKAKSGQFDTRQAAPKVYQANGAIYVINVKSLMDRSIKEFSSVLKFEMDEIKSIDIDTPLDFAYCEFLISKGYWKPE